MIDLHKIKVIEQITDVRKRVDEYIDYLFEIRKFNPGKSIDIATVAANAAEQEEYFLGFGRALNHKAFCLAQKADYQLALATLDKALAVAQKIKDKGLEARVCKNFGSVYRNLGKLSESFTYYEEAIYIYEKIDRPAELGDVLLQISNLHLDLYEYENALEYAQQCLPLITGSKHIERVVEAHYTLGNIYWKQKNYGAALEEFHQVCGLSSQESISFMLGEVALGQVACDQNRLDVAHKFLKQGLEKAKVLNHIEGLITARFYLGKVLLKEHEIKKAKKHLLKAYDLAQEHSRQHNVMSIHGMLANLFEEAGNIKKAYFHLKNFEKIKEEIFQQNTIDKLRHLQTRQEMELATKEKEVAKQTATLKQQFIANMSHEIRTPMNAIVGMTRQLVEKEPREDQKRYLSYIRKSADNLLVIINDILDFSKIEAGKVRIEQVNFSLKDCLKNVVNTLRIKAEEKGLKLWFEMEENVPQTVTGDPTRLTQVLINLVGNAIKFTEKGKVDILVSLEKINNEDHHILFQVIDTGIGISEDYVNQIFESFTQAGTDMARKYGGTGLGLTISNELVHLMNGQIGVKSKLGIGTTFEFSLPFAVPNEQVLEKEDKLFTLTTEEKSLLNNMHILLAEDNEFNKILAEDVLLDMAPNMKISHAENGVDVIEFLEKEICDLILMDIQMPVMTGLEATKVLRKKYKELPVIAMTANVMQDDIEAYLDGGMNDHIPKPFEKEDLFTKILNYVNKDSIELKNDTIIVDKKAESLELNPTITQHNTTYINDAFLRNFTNNNQEKMNKYLNLFLQNAPQMEQKLNDAITNKNHADVKIAAHSLKSQLKYLGVKEEDSGVYALEQMGTHKEDLSVIKNAFEKLQVVLAHCYNEAKSMRIE